MGRERKLKPLSFYHQPVSATAATSTTRTPAPLTSEKTWGAVLEFVRRYNGAMRELMVPEWFKELFRERVYAIGQALRTEREIPDCLSLRSISLETPLRHESARLFDELIDWCHGNEQKESA